MRLVWYSELATGSRLIDDQHKRLFQLFNDLNDAAGRRQGEAEVRRTLTALSVYVVAHFRMEEELMSQCGYPERAAHHEAHEALRIQVEEMVDQYNAHLIDPTQVLRMLTRWLVEHVLNDDKAMARFLIGCQDPVTGP